jgi:hypothetical protein
MSVSLLWLYQLHPFWLGVLTTMGGAATLKKLS